MGLNSGMRNYRLVNKPSYTKEQKTAIYNGIMNWEHKYTKLDQRNIKSYE